MKESINEIILKNLLAEREMAIASGNLERLEYVKIAIAHHQRMMIEEVMKKQKSEMKKD